MELLLIANWIVIVIFALIGIAFRAGRFHDLMAGYNTASEEDKKYMQESGLFPFVGNGLIFLALLLAIGTLLGHMGYPFFADLVWAIFVIGILIILIGAQKFTPKTEKNKSKGAILFTIVIMLFFVGLVWGSIQESKVTIEAEGILVSGFYSENIAFAEIEEVRLQDNIPKIVIRTNGLSIGPIQKGNYRLEEWGSSRLHLHSREGPYLVIYTKEKPIVLNFRDEDKSRQIYEEINRKILEQ
ncbi:DUF3784 domain-containing protein [Heliorestis acidaminivorans]|uniref:DUF3784 domain-containing protein n=1 Tax=Heliorestis acidaminivorans TaxID=553427 RepID=UPI0014795A7A|nr:DUF3784 domain-containing protein [Heliorestis acidaminivorans]